MIDFLQHEFFMALAGLIFFFWLKYSVMKNKGRVSGFKVFWEDQNDEVITSVIGGLIFIVWDDEVLRTIELILEWVGLREEGGTIEMERAFYLLVGPVIERVYTLYGMIGKKKDV